MKALVLGLLLLIGLGVVALIFAAEYYDEHDFPKDKIRYELR